MSRRGKKSGRVRIPCASCAVRLSFTKCGSLGLCSGCFAQLPQEIKHNLTRARHDRSGRKRAVQVAVAEAVRFLRRLAG